MDEPYGRAFATVYLVAWPTLIVGVILLAFTDAMWAFGIVAASAVPLVVLGSVLARGRDRGERRPHWYSLAPSQWAWYELVLGVEARRAWQVLRRSYR